MSSMLVADCWLGKVDGVAAARGILAQGCKLVIVVGCHDDCKM
jgi:hypothetical protein